MTRHTVHSRIEGCLYMLAAMFCFALMNTLIRLISHDLPTAQIVFLRNIISVLILLPWVIYEGKALLRTERMVGHFWRAALGVVSMSMWFRVIALMNLSQATALSFTTPIFVTLAAIVVLKEKTDARRLFAIAIGFVGMLIIAGRGAGAFNAASLLALASFAITAVTSILVKTLTRTERSGTIVFYMALFMTPLSALPAWMNWQPLGHLHLLLAIAIAFFSTVAHFLLTRAYSCAEMTIIIPIDFTRLLFTAGFAYMFFGETVDMRTLGGAALIVTGAALSATINAREMRRRIEEEELSDVKE